MALVQALINAVLVGCFYAAVALGFSLVWGIMNIVNLAHGSFVLVGAYVAWKLADAAHIDPFLGMFGSMAVMFVIGWVVQFVAINRVIRAPLLVTFLFTFGLDLLVIDSLQRIFTGNLRSINLSYGGAGLTLGSLNINYSLMAIALVAVLLTGGLTLFLNRTRLGNAILATGMDRDAARLMGINIAQIYALTFAIGAALAGAAGALLGIKSSFDPSIGGDFTRVSFIIVVLGGLGSPWTVIAGGFVFALVQQVLPVFNNNLLGYTDVLAFVVFVIVLFVRPNGLFGKPVYA